MCGTCRYCVGFFQAAGVFSGIMQVLITFIRVMFGGMPPIYSYVIGFWTQFITNLIAIYLVLLTVRTVGRGIAVLWIHKYIFVILVILVFLYAAGSAFMFVPVTEYRMLSFSRDYYKRMKIIPEFLNTFQYQYSCCGIRNYKDYNDKNLFYMRVENGYSTERVVTPFDQTWFIVELLYTMYGKTGVNKTVREHHHGFQVPQSCCSPKVYHKKKDCGKYVEFGIREGSYNEEQRYKRSALNIVNNSSLGCFEKYTTILNSGPSFQLPWLIGLLRWGALVLFLVYLALLWAYKVTVRATRKDKYGNPIVDLKEGEKFGDEEDSMMAAIRRRPDATPPLVTEEALKHEQESALKKEKWDAYVKDLDEKKWREAHPLHHHPEAKILSKGSRSEKGNSKSMSIDVDFNYDKPPENYVIDLAKLTRSKTVPASAKGKPAEAVKWGGHNFNLSAADLKDRLTKVEADKKEQSKAVSPQPPPPNSAASKTKTDKK